MALMVLGGLCAGTAAPADETSIKGLWIHHEKWDYAPKEINEGGDVHKSASAAIVNFCPRGVFRLATGVVYQSTKNAHAGIGSSDGLAIYSGTWSVMEDAIRVEYRLVSAEFANLRDDPEVRRTHVAELVRKKGRLRFDFATVFGKTWQLDLIPAARYEKKLEDWHVECPAKPH